MEEGEVTFKSPEVAIKAEDIKGEALDIKVEEELKAIAEAAPVLPVEALLEQLEEEAKETGEQDGLTVEERVQMTRETKLAILKMVGNLTKRKLERARDHPGETVFEVAFERVKTKTF